MRGTRNSSVQFKRDAIAVLRDTVGPENPPSVPNATAASLSVVFSWTASEPSFPDGYDLEYTVNGGAVNTIAQATSTETIVVAEGDVVCGRLVGYKGGLPSEPSAFDCATATA